MINGTKWSPSLNGSECFDMHLIPQITETDNEILEKLVCKKVFSNFDGNILQQLAHLKYKHFGYRKVYDQYVIDMFESFINHQKQIIINCRYDKTC